MTSEKRRRIEGYQEDYLRLYGEYIKIVPCTKWHSVVDLNIKVDLWKMVKIVCDFTGWTYEQMYNLSRKQEVVFKRGLIDFIVVNNGCTINSTARFTDRDHVTVINSVTKFENRLETEDHVRRFFYEIINYVKENYYLYDNQDITKESLRDVT